jgi:hypothetical protein
MDQKNIKQRDVLDFDKFKTAYDVVQKVLMLKKDGSAHPGSHVIKGENLYVRNDANPYKAMGIAYDEEQADINKYISADKVDVFHNHKLTTEEKKKVTDAYGNEVVTHHQVAFILDENIHADLKTATFEEAIYILAETNNFDVKKYKAILEEEESKEESKEEVDPDDEYRAKYTGQTVILNGDSAKIYDEEGIATIKSKENELRLPWKEINNIITTKDGNFKMKVEKKEEPKEDKKEEKKEEKPKEEKKVKKITESELNENKRKNYFRKDFQKYPYQIFFSDHNMADAVGADSVAELIEHVAKARNLKAFAIFKGGSDFRSTTDEKHLISWYDSEDADYWFNRSKHEPELLKERITSL